MDSGCVELKFENPIKDAISRIEFAPSSNKLLISSWDSMLRLYDVDSSILKVEAPSEAALLDCCFQDELVAFTAGSDGLIRRYYLQSGIVDTLGSHDYIVTCIGYSNETRQLITAGLDKKILLWDILMDNAPTCLKNLGAEVDSLSISGFNLMVGVGTLMQIYDLRNFVEPVQSKEPHRGTSIRCVSLASYSKGFAVGSVDGRVAIQISYSSNSDDIGYAFRCHPKSKNGRQHLASVNDIIFNPLVCGTFVTGDDEGHVTIWDAKSRRRLSELPRFPNSVASLSYNHEGQILAVASSYTYREAKETEKPPHIFIHKAEDFDAGSVFVGSSANSS